MADYKISMRQDTNAVEVIVVGTGYLICSLDLQAFKSPLSVIFFFICRMLHYNHFNETHKIFFKIPKSCPHDS